MMQKLKSEEKCEGKEGEENGMDAGGKERKRK